MLINAKSAQTFMNEYASLLIEVVNQKDPTTEYESIIHALAAGRKMIVETPALIDDAITSLKKQKIAISPDVISAIKTLQQKRWIYLRDTTKYSIFIDPNEEEAYAVLGLTDRIKSLSGDSAVIFETGVLVFQGQYICDGIIQNPIWFGRNMQQEFSEKLAQLKKSGHFHKQVP